MLTTNLAHAAPLGDPAQSHSSSPWQRRLVAGCLGLAWFASAMLTSHAPVSAQTTAPAASTYVPMPGQAGKDVIWLPSSGTLVDKMLDMAKVTPKDYLIDLGSGDGRTVITAARRGLRAHGIEYNPELVELSTRNAQQAGVADRATFAKADIFESDYSKAQVITLFLLPQLNEKLRPTLLNMLPGTRVVSNSFPMGDWQPDEQATVTQDCQTYCTALLWIVPAKVAGNWRFGEQRLELKQEFQMLGGTLGGAPISDARLRGEEISFTANGVRYTGMVRGNGMEGRLANGSAWSATRM